MNPHIRLLLLVLCCLPLTAADLVWPATHTGDQPPAGWEIQAGEGASVRFAGTLDRRDDAADCILQGGATTPACRQNVQSYL